MDLKENIIKVIDNLSKNPYFDNHRVFLTINYKEVVRNRTYDFDSKVFTDSIFKDENDRGAEIHGNFFEYDNIDKTIDLLIEFDELIDRQYLEKKEIYDKLEFFL